MCQYGADNGTPSCANSAINNDLYRKTYGWDGFMVSDCDSVAEFPYFPKINVSRVSPCFSMSLHAEIATFGCAVRCCAVLCRSGACA